MATYPRGETHLLQEMRARPRWGGGQARIHRARCASSVGTQIVEKLVVSGKAPIDSMRTGTASFSPQVEFDLQPTPTRPERAKIDERRYSVLSPHSATSSRLAKHPAPTVKARRADPFALAERFELQAASPEPRHDCPPFALAAPYPLALSVLLHRRRSRVVDYGCDYRHRLGGGKERRVVTGYSVKTSWNSPPHSRHRARASGWARPTVQGFLECARTCTGGVTTPSPLPHTRVALEYPSPRAACHDGKQNRLGVRSGASAVSAVFWLTAVTAPRRTGLRTKADGCALKFVLEGK